MAQLLVLSSGFAAGVGLDRHGYVDAAVTAITEALPPSVIDKLHELFAKAREALPRGDSAPQLSAVFPDSPLMAHLPPVAAPSGKGGAVCARKLVTKRAAAVVLGLAAAALVARYGVKTLKKAAAEAVSSAAASASAALKGTRAGDALDHAGAQASELYDAVISSPPAKKLASELSLASERLSAGLSSAVADAKAGSKRSLRFAAASAEPTAAALQQALARLASDLPASALPPDAPPTAGRAAASATSAAAAGSTPYHTPVASHAPATPASTPAAAPPAQPRPGPPALVQ